MIVTAFAEGDRRQLKNLLSREVYDGFDAAIGERESRGETAETPLRLDRQSDITAPSCAAAPRRSRCASSPSSSRSRATATGNVIDGNPEKVTDVTDVWTFARDLSSRDPNWKLVATEAGQ